MKGPTPVIPSPSRKSRACDSSFFYSRASGRCSSWSGFQKGILPIMKQIILIVLIVISALPAFAAPSCEDLAKVALPNAAISGAQSVAAGSFTPPDSRPIEVTAAFCRVSLVLKPSSDSDIKLEVWLPASGWNGKFQGVGNGGFAGSIGWDQMAAACAKGYATASTYTGHRGGATGATWVGGYPEKIRDFGYRAIHESAEKGKTLTK